ncbi:phosphotransferase enzyme family protein [Lewinellaceae bacterium SD302]|nr:phosphotransferase enzyme family protein [Lewinellaceae bacterium SD302]
MSNLAIESDLNRLFTQWAGRPAELLLPLAPSGSKRMYYRLQAGDKVAIGAYHLDARENEAFISFSRHFKALDLPVPEIYATDLNQHIYLQEDLGSTTLYSYLLQRGDYWPDYLTKIYQRVVEQLARLQIIGGKELDYSKCYPRAAFDRQSIRWDFNYFKYYFLKLAGVDFDEDALETDAERLADYLLEADGNYFMFRDFQTRNIMVKSGEPVFIDYQGGRRGALQYDLASLLFQAKANLPEDIRTKLLEHYLDAAGELIDLDRKAFSEHYYGFVFIRCLQVLGAYGFRGLYERKEHFLQSIPFALRNLDWLLTNDKLVPELPELTRALRQLIDDKQFEPFDKIRGSSSLLKVSVASFSYKKGGIPADESGNGGGFIFDCRALHNPGRYEPYKKQTGRDEAVINFLNHHSQMPDFLQNVFRIVDPAVENYIDRSFTHLQVSFGCTGGQHRSVYAADQLTAHLRKKYGVEVDLHHIEQEKKNWKN